jgi:four helix bundle protein
MPAITRFEDIAAWQGARGLVRDVYRITGSGPFSRDFGARDQMRRAAVSVMNNIAEGYERDNDREFHRFLAIAKGSAGEVRSLLYVALDMGYIDQQQHESLTKQGIQISRQLARLMQYLSGGERE